MGRKFATQILPPFDFLRPSKMILFNQVKQQVVDFKKSFFATFLYFHKVFV
jgi:hypothetical protein